MKYKVTLLIIGKMKTTEQTAAVKGNYRSPQVIVSEIINEGVLCMSGNHEGWIEETPEW